MKANRIAQIAIAAGIALTASVPAFSAPASSLEQTTQATATSEQTPREARHHGERKAGEHRHHRAHQRDGMMLRGIELNAEQKTKVAALREAAAPELREAMKQAFAARKELRDMTFSGKFDEARAKELAKTGADAMANATVLRAKTDSQIIALLTPEQRKELTDRAQRMKEQHNGARHGKPGEQQPGKPAQAGQPAAPVQAAPAAAPTPAQ